MRSRVSVHVLNESAIFTLLPALFCSLSTLAAKSFTMLTSQSVSVCDLVYIGGRFHWKQLLCVAGSNVKESSENDNSKVGGRATKTISSKSRKPSVELRATESGDKCGFVFVFWSIVLIKMLTVASHFFHIVIVLTVHISLSQDMWQRFPPGLERRNN